MSAPIPMPDKTVISNNQTTTTMTLLGRVLQDVKNFLNRVEHKLPTIITDAAAFGLGFTKQAEMLLLSATVVDIATIVPQGEPLREEILSILKEMETAFAAVSGLYKQTTLLAAATKIAQLKTGNDVPINVVMLGVQAEYSKG